MSLHKIQNVFIENPPQRLRKKLWPSSLSCPRETCFRKILGCSLRLIQAKCGKQGAFGQVLPCVPLFRRCLARILLPNVFHSSSTTPVNPPLSPRKPNTPFPHFSPLSRMSHIPSVASLSLEFSWNDHVYVNSPSTSVKLWFSPVNTHTQIQHFPSQYIIGCIFWFNQCF